MISIFRLGWCHVLSNGVGSTRLRRTLALQASLSFGSAPARPHTLISGLTHSDHVFLCLPFHLGLGSGRSARDLIQDVALYACPYHLRPLRRTAVIPVMPSFWSSETEDVSTRSLVPQIHQIMARSLQRSLFMSKMFRLFHAPTRMTSSGCFLLHRTVHALWNLYGNPYRNRAKTEEETIP